MTKQKLTTLAWAGAALVGGPLTLGSALADSSNPFLAQPLERAQTQLAQAEGKCGEGCWVCLRTRLACTHPPQARQG